MSVNFDELQQETEKLLALLKDRQPGILNWHMLMKERLESHHALTGKALSVEPSSSKNSFKVIVDYGKSLKDMIATGNYDYVDPDINENHFPINPPACGSKSEVEVELVHYNKLMKSEEIFADFKVRGLPPAPIEVLYAVGEERPELLREFPIVAFGSVWQRWDGYRFVPYLWDGLGGGRLLLEWFEGDWHGRYRFLALRGSLPAGRQV